MVLGRKKGMSKIPRMAYFLLETERDKNGNFIPCIAKEYERGYYRTSWTYGKDRDLAEATIQTLNMRMGISEQEAARIVASTMGKLRKEKVVEQ
jgi:hypothetical protein